MRFLPTAARKIRPLTELVRLVRRAQRRGNTVVFTNGCFDLLHAGHITLLERARRCGDLLIVGLNSDRSVRHLKRRGRPILPQRERARLLAALESVDYVTIFHEPTPAQALSRLRPNVLVKGADWKTGEIVGAQEVRSWGGSVRRLRFVAGRSTTRVLKKIAPERCR